MYICYCFLSVFIICSCLYDFNLYRYHKTRSFFLYNLHKLLHYALLFQILILKVNFNKTQEQLTLMMIHKFKP